MPSFDHVVTQWMSPVYVDGGSACISSHVHVVGGSTWPSTVNVQVAGSIFGVASAVEHGPLLARVVLPGWEPGVTFGLCPRPMKPRVNLAIPDSVARARGSLRWVVSGADATPGGTSSRDGVMDASVYVGDGVLEVQQVAVPEARAAPTCSSRSVSAGSAAPTCTWCSRRSPDPGPCSGTSGRGRSPRSVTRSRAGRSVTASSAGRRPDAASAARASRAARRCASTARSPTTSTSAARTRSYVVAPAAQLLAIPEALSIARGRVGRADRRRDARGDAVGCDARGPRVGDRRRSSRSARDCGAARAGHPRRHGLGTVADPTCSTR